LKIREICCDIGKGERRQKITLYFVQTLGNEKEEKTREKMAALWEKKRDLYREKKKKKLENKFVFCTILRK
jgi:hypothetical protein